MIPASVWTSTELVGSSSSRIGCAVPPDLPIGRDIRALG
jgi:hypothetical protein